MRDRATVHGGARQCSRLTDARGTGTWYSWIRLASVRLGFEFSRIRYDDKPAALGVPRKEREREREKAIYRTRRTLRVACEKKRREREGEKERGNGTSDGGATLSGLTARRPPPVYPRSPRCGRLLRFSLFSVCSPRAPCAAPSSPLRVRLRPADRRRRGSISRSRSRLG